MAVVRGQFLGLGIDIEKDFRKAYESAENCINNKHNFKSNLAYFIIQDGVVVYPPVCEHCGEMKDC